MRSRVARTPVLGGAALALAAGLVAAGAAPAGAHATLIATAPAADGVVDAVPDLVELQFDEPVETVDDAVQVFGPDGGRVDLGTVEAADGGATLRAPVEADARGTYTVAWRVTSEDSHTLTGSFVFHNGTRTGAVDLDAGGGGTATSVLGGVGRWLGFAGALAAVGAATVALLLPPRPAGAGAGRAGRRPGDATGPGSDPGPPGGAGASGDAGTASGAAATLTVPDAPTVPDAEGAPAAAPHGHGAASARLRRVALGGAAASAVGAALALLAVVAEGSGRSAYDALAVVADVAPETRTGRLALLRVALAASAAIVAGVPALWRRTPVPVLSTAGASLVVATIAGHAWTAPDRGLAVAADLVHLGAVAVWIGGLVALLAVLPLIGPDGRASTAARFSGLAVVAVVLVAVSGTVSGWQQVRTLDALTSTTYGRLLVAKVAGVAGLVALGYRNRTQLVPLVGRAVGPLRRSLRVEVVVAAVVLAVTAALIHQPPARTQATEPFDTTVTAASGEVLTATVDPAEAGPNDIHLYVFGPDGAEPAAVDAVQVTAATDGVPARRLQVTPVSTNHVTVAGASLPSSGTWTIEVTAVQAGRPLVFRFEVTIA